MSQLEKDEVEGLMVYQVMSLWLKYRSKLIHYYSLVGYNLAPTHWIMADTAERMSESHINIDAITRFIDKLF